MLTKTSSGELKEQALAHSEIDSPAQNSTISALKQEILKLKQEATNIGIYEMKLNEKNIELKSYKNKNFGFEREIEAQNKEIMYLERSLK